MINGAGIIQMEKTKGRTGQGTLDNIVGVNINYEWAEKGINPRRIKDRYQSIGNYRLLVKMLL